MPATTDTRLSYHPALDGLRGAAILSVMLAHGLVLHLATGPVGLLTRVARYGWLGVDLFFVLSGFLITAILLRTPPTRAGLKNFFLRRILRTWPLYYPCLLLGFFVFPFIPTYASADLGHAFRNQLWYHLHACNIYFAVQHNWSASFLEHFWSLAVEEQFYLLWPLVVLPKRGRLVPWACLALIPVSAAFRIFLFHQQTGYIRLRVLLPDNADSLLFGALAALAYHRLGPARLRPLAWTILLLSVSYAGYCMAADAFPGNAFNAFVQPAIVPGFAALIYLLLSPLPAMSLPFGGGPLPFLGKYAYGLYVLHLFLRPVFELAGTPHEWALRLGINFGSLTYAALLILLSLAAAIPTYHLWEKRWLQLKRRYR